jgi:hypothetical protein
MPLPAQVTLIQMIKGVPNALKEAFLRILNQMRPPFQNHIQVSYTHLRVTQKLTICRWTKMWSVLLLDMLSITGSSGWGAAQVNAEPRRRK